ncbi:MAG: fibronectin type III domain-containing protein, partial [Actinomycetota bacterium]|nr:fibronectin type III domain-containing protein [Actinomycetota bacterium]
MTGLEGGRLYSFVVRGVSAAGEGALSEAFTQSTSPGAPSGLASVSQTTSSITLEWTAPAEHGGDSVSEFVLYMDNGSGESAAVSTEAYRGALSSSVEVSGLVGGRSYKFAVSAVSASGEGDRSEVLSQSTAPAALSAAPVSVSQTASSIHLSWSAPSVSTGLSATGYRVYDAESSALVYDGAGSMAEEAVVSGLESGRLYSYAVSALSESGEGDVSASVSVSTAPGLVTGLASVHQTSSSITLEWVALEVSTGSAVSGFKVYERVVHGLSAVSDLFAAGGVSEDVVEHFLDPAESDMVIDTLVHDGRGSTDGRAVLSGLSGGVEYTYVVSAVSDAGEGERSESVAVSTSPAAPTGLHTTFVNYHTTSVAWLSPSAGTGA